ncbi:phage baseplate assembly protein V [Arachidicoccus terrestris]|uniref:phage baseplate assembly protein V n=1 Tax=Arachidicoccus terrestris TaxID=2875539 RepID=UPI001CC37A86|nr:phage baseplate assembly protein V [Arachidicoccus terrestris]UAY57284.1 phage baseplate assembly protein V [Arachidicoccus terrestris]
MHHGTILKYGLVCEVKPGYAKVNFDDDDDLATDWLPVLVRRSQSDKESWQLEINEHVVCLMINDGDDGVIIGAIYSDEDTPDNGEAAGKFRKLFSDGTLIEYDKTLHKLTASVKGDIAINAAGDAQISAKNIQAVATQKAAVSAAEIEATGSTSAKIVSPVITLQGAVTVTGALTAATIATTGGGAITSTGDMNITGKIEAGGEIKGGSVVVGDIDLGTHTHSGVTTGAGTSGPPVP